MNARQRRRRRERKAAAKKLRAARTRLPRNPTKWDYLVQYHYRRCAQGDITAAYLRELAERQKTCPYCDRELTDENRQLEHEIPISRGGANWKQNVCFCCATCNGRKYTKNFAEFARQIGLARVGDPWRTGNTSAGGNGGTGGPGQHRQGQAASTRP